MNEDIKLMMLDARLDPYDTNSLILQRSLISYIKRAEETAHNAGYQKAKGRRKCANCMLDAKYLNTKDATKYCFKHYTESKGRNG